MKITIEMNTESKSDITALGRINSALQWEDFGDDPDEVPPIVPSDPPRKLLDAPGINPETGFNVAAETARAEAETVDAPPSAPKKGPGRGRKAPKKEETPAAPEQPPAPEQTVTPPAVMPLPKDETPAKPAPTPEPLNDFSDFDIEAPETPALTRAQMIEQIAALMRSLRAIPGGKAFNEIYFKYALDGKKLDLQNYPEDKLPGLLEAADKALNEANK